MRNLKSKVILFSVALAALSSCYKDLSTELAEELRVIDSPFVDSIITVAYGSPLVFNPEVARADGSTEGLEYAWYINMIPNNWELLDYGEEAELRCNILQSPNSKPYMLRLEVNDPQRDMHRYFHWPIYVTNPFGEGLLVAYTNDGGKTSDIDLVASQSVTYGFQYAFPSYTRGIRTLATGAPFEGRVNTMGTYAYSLAGVHDNDVVLIGTDRELIGLDPTTFAQSLSNDQFFTLPLSDGNYTLERFELVAGQDIVLLIGGRLYSIPTKITSTFSPVAYLGAGKDSFTKASFCGGNKNSQNSIYAYDSQTRQFVTARGWNLFQSSLSNISAIGQLPAGSEALAAGECAGFGGFLMKESGRFKAYLIQIDAWTDSWQSFDVECDDLNDAVSIAFCDNTPIMFYATENKVGSIILSEATGVTVRKISWKPDNSAEKITGIYQYRQAWYAHKEQFTAEDYAFILPTNRSQMLITTYNPKTGEGKIYIRPFNINTGLFTMKDGGTLDGFGEITAITTTNR